MAKISVQPAGPAGTFLVTVDGSRYTVDVPDGYVGKVAGPGTTPEACLEASFRFLLDREPKESILSRFSLPVIARYFPEYETALSGYL